MLKIEVLVWFTVNCTKKKKTQKNQKTPAHQRYQIFSKEEKEKK